MIASERSSTADAEFKSPELLSMSLLGEAAMLLWFRGGRPGSFLPSLHIIAERLRESFHSRVVDIVPAAASILITFDPQQIEEPELKEAFAQILTETLIGRESAPRHHVVPVAYGNEDGPDLEAVARRHRVQPETIVRAHTAGSFRVGFLGFLPGFAYLGPLPLGIATRRIETPRIQVPPGSVGIAGMHTGIYPFSSPGGWNLIGRTDARLWDPEAEQPALFSPGDTVSFADSDAGSHLGAALPTLPSPRFPVFQVESVGGMSTIQDLGRPGYAHIGLGRGGVSDELAAVRANALIGNPSDSAVLEMGHTGPTFHVVRGTVMALEGADLGCRVDGLGVPTGVSWFVRAGSTITFTQTSPSESGATGFMAIPGGFDVQSVLKSRSTCIIAGFGGLGGRPIRTGDVLGTGRAPDDNSLLAGRYWLPKVDLRIKGHALLRVIRYAGRGSVSHRAYSHLLTKQWVVSRETSRAGMRLVPADGEPLEIARRGFHPFGVVRGTVQIPPGGNPLVLGVDSGTTGGYPVACVVAQCDWPLLAQLRPGDNVAFAEITVAEARAARHGQVMGIGQGLIRLSAL
jgi:KipI family sensor histidine kinase inhibitor